MLKTAAFLLATSALGATLVASHSGDQAKEFDRSISAGDARQLTLRIPLGELHLIADGGNNLTVHAVRSVKGRVDEDARKWMNDSYITVENHDGALIVRDHPFGAEVVNKTHENIKSSDLNLDVQVHVPANMAANLEVSVGTVEVRGRYGKVDAHIGAGTLNTDKMQCDGEMAMNVGAGEIDSALVAGSRSGAHLHVGAGRVKLSIPAGADARVSAAAGMGEISGLPASKRSEDGMHLGDERWGSLGQGDAKVDIHVGTGNITVSAADLFHAVAAPAEDMASVSEGEAPMVLDQTDGDIKSMPEIDETVRKAVREALAQAKIALQMLPKDIDIKVKVKDQMTYTHVDLDDLGPTLAKALANVQPEIDKAMRQARPEIERAIRRAMEEMKRAEKEMDRAMKDQDR